MSLFISILDAQCWLAKPQTWYESVECCLFFYTNKLCPHKHSVDIYPSKLYIGTPCFWHLHPAFTSMPRKQLQLRNMIIRQSIVDWKWRKWKWKLFCGVDCWPQNMAWSTVILTQLVHMLGIKIQRPTKPSMRYHVIQPL